MAMKFKFETGKVIDVVDEHIIKLLKADKRYVEVKDEVTEKTVEPQVEKPKATRKSGK